MFPHIEGNKLERPTWWFGIENIKAILASKPQSKKGFVGAIEGSLEPLYFQTNIFGTFANL